MADTVMVAGGVVNVGTSASPVWTDETGSWA
jgi:hypothetical protein